MMKLSISVEECAAICHEANRSYCEVVMNDTSQLSWEDAPGWQKQSAQLGVRAALKGKTPEQLHESWLAEKKKDGWKFGTVKDAIEKTHPCFVPYAELPEEQKKKDRLFQGVVLSFVEK